MTPHIEWWRNESRSGRVDWAPYPCTCPLEHDHDHGSTEVKH